VGNSDSPVNLGELSTHMAIPEGWTITQLKEIGEWQTGGTPSRVKPEYFSGGIPWVKICDLNDGVVNCTEETISERGLQNSAAKLLPVGTICVGIYGSIGKLGILSVPAATNQACANCIVDEDVIERNFLFFYLLSQRDILLSSGRGGTQANINNKIMREWPILVPPLPEQRRIVASLEALLADTDRVRGRLDAVAATMQQFRRAVLAGACSGRLTEGWREEHHVLLQVSWKLLKLQDIGEWQTGGTPSRSNPEYFGGGIPWVKITDLNDGMVNRTEETISRKGLENSSAKLLPPGSICVGIYGSIGKIGILGMPATTNQACANCIVNENVVELKYLFYYIISQRETLLSKGRGGTQPNINNRILREWPIYLPSPPEQHEIVRRVDALFALADRIESEVAGARGRVEALREAVLAKAFRGELVPTEAELARREGRGYESAAALLERVRAERQGNTPKMQGRKRGTAGQCRLTVD